MPHYRKQPPTPRTSPKAPAYPRLLGLGILVAAACGGSVVDNAGDGTGGTPPPDGDIAPAWDSGTGGTAGTAGWGTGGGGAPYPWDSGLGGSGGVPVPDSSGVAPYPYDASDAQDEAPQLGGEPPDPFDASSDVWPDVIDGGVPDAISPGYAPDPYDAGCEASLPDDPGS